MSYGSLRVEADWISTAGMLGYVWTSGMQVMVELRSESTGSARLSTLAASNVSAREAMVWGPIMTETVRDK